MLYYIIFKINIKVVIICTSLIVILFFLFITIELDTYNLRFINLLLRFLEDPTAVLRVDESINARVAAIYFSIKGFFDNYGIANGFGTFSSYLSIELPKQNLFWGLYESNRIMSFYGGALYELGIISLLIPITYSMIIYKAYRYKIRDVFVYLFFINTILFTAIPLSFPFVGIYMAALLYKVKHQD